MENNIVLKMTGIDMFFPGVHALEGVDFTLRKKEIHSIMGENGAGKSTLIKVLTGAYKKNNGSILLDGVEFNPSGPLEARHHGVNSVYQEINLCDNLTVAENIYAGRQKTRLGKINWKAIKSGAKDALARLNIDVDVNNLLGDYTVGIKQMVAIARAVDMNSKVLILDEPTSSLDRPEVEQLFDTVRKLRDDGLSVIFISHFLEQVYELCDRVTVLRNGKLIGEYELKNLPRYELVSKMIGKDFSILKNREKKGVSKETSDVFIEAKKLGKRRAVEPFDLLIRKGEILGLAGLLGSGRTEVVNLFFGIYEADTGEMLLKNKKKSFKKPSDAINQLIGFCPEDRKRNGVIYDLSVEDNIILAMQAKDGIFKLMSKKKKAEIVEEYIKKLGIVTTGSDMVAGTLSGGNQQKVILARWLVTNPNLLILDEPTRGVDVGAKIEIFKIINEMVALKNAVVIISSEMAEVIGMCDRAVIIREGVSVGVLDKEELTEENIINYSMGVTANV